MPNELSLEEQLAICDAATAPPWTIYPDDLDGFYPAGTTSIEGWTTIGNGETAFPVIADATFCAQARTGYPAALRKLIRLRTLLAPALECGAEQEHECGVTEWVVTLTEEEKAEVRELLGIED